MKRVCVVVAAFALSMSLVAPSADEQTLRELFTSVSIDSCPSRSADARFVAPNRRG